MRLSLNQLWPMLLAALLAGALTGAGRPAAAQPIDPLAGEGEVVLQVVDFGVGNVARQGEYVGIRLELMDRGDRQREIVLRLNLSDADGDRPQYERTVATNPGQRQETWLYCRLPYRFDSALGGELLITAHAAIETEGEREFRAGRRLGAVQARRSRIVASTDGLLGIVGREPLGLLRFEDAVVNAFQDGGHEPLRLAQRLTPAGLPDRPEGLLQFSALIWAGTEEAPQRLTADQADALRTWIQWGGRLLVVVPPVGETWSAGPLNNPLADIVPRVRFERHESVALAPLRPLLTDRPPEEAALPETVVVHTFTALEDALPHEAVCVLEDPEGACIVVSRRVGLGQVALIGIDLTGGLMRRYALPDADVFWNRILGRRGDLVSRDERDPTMRTIPNRMTRVLDGDTGAAISEEGQAAAGVLLGFVVFIAYWAVAGPGLYAVLKKANRTSHAWVGFVAAALVFTVIAWGGAALIKTRNVRASHVSVIDHVYGEPLQRTRSWVSVLTPWYGDATVRVAGDGEGRERTFASIAPWSAPGVTLGGGFPDARGYTLAGDGATSITYPARSTIKEFQADWLGDPLWHMPRPVAGFAPVDDNPVLTIKRGGLPGDQESAVTGALRHGLPAALEGVLVIVVHGQQDIGRGGTPAQLIAHASAFAKTGSWEPGETLDLGALTLRDQLSERVRLEDYVDPLVQRVRADQAFAGAITGPGADYIDQLTLASILSQLIEPQTDTTSPVDRREGLSAALLREGLHGFDLGRWFTRPCVIVIGHLGVSGQPVRCPTPLEVEGRAIEPMGRTMVRWVYPVEEAPPMWRAPGPLPQSPISSPVPADGRPPRGGRGGG